jgi:hypothetical protein
MRMLGDLVSGWIFRPTLLVVVAWNSILMVSTQAQTTGNKAVYNASGTYASSSAYVDASVFAGSDICQKIYNALTSIPAGTKFVDARGITSNMTCGATETPWLSNGTNAIVQSTILLPAGTINVSRTWIIPDGTRVIGEGIGGEGTGGSTSGTTLSAGNFTGPMIQMGDGGVHCPGTGNICHGISVEDLTLDGEGKTINGIVNANSQELSYVSHVKFFQVMGTGLTVNTNAQNSGPYSNITFDTGGLTPTTSTACAQIIGLTGTRGLHGLSCISSTIAPAAAVYLDSSNNSIKDVIIEGFTDGIRVGSQSAAHSNVLFNVLGDTTLITGTQAPATITVIHVTKNSGSPVSDLSIVGVRNTGLGTTIQDDVTGQTLLDPSVSIYALGEAGLGGVGFSRFTTSPNAANWGVGGQPPVGPCTTNNYGSLYSRSAAGTPSLWVCENAVSGPTWVQIL